MLSTSGNSCICSSCFSRSYKLYDGRQWVARKKGSIKPLGQPTSEQTEKVRETWRRYLARSAEQKVKAQAKSILRQKRVLTEYAAETTEVVKEIRSEVFLESPTSSEDRKPIWNLNNKNFWDFVYQHQWKGRIRVCEGELMYRITETFKKLVNLKVISDFKVTRLFAADYKKKDGDEEDRTSMLKVQEFVVRVDQTYYGGEPRKPPKMVKFNLVPNSVFTPRLKCISPILKRNGPATSCKIPHTPRVDVATSLTSRDVSNSNQWKSVSDDISKDEFTSVCLKATKDFVVVKEMITNSKTLKTSTSFTLRRKEGLFGTSGIAVTMKDFYTSSSLPEHSYDAPEFKATTPFLEMVI